MHLKVIIEIDDDGHHFEQVNYWRTTPDVLQEQDVYKSVEQRVLLDSITSKTGLERAKCLETEAHVGVDSSLQHQITVLVG